MHCFYWNCPRLFCYNKTILGSFINVINQQMWTISVKNKRPCHTVFKSNFWTFPWYPNIDEEPSFVQVTSIRFPVSTSWNRTQAPSFDCKPLSASLTFFFEASHMPVASWYLTNPSGHSLERLLTVFRPLLRELFWTDLLAMEFFWWSFNFISPSKSISLFLFSAGVDRSNASTW